MMDTYNLGWKLASVIHGTAQPSILSTCKFCCAAKIAPKLSSPIMLDNTERHAVANDLIEFDRKIAGLFSGKPATREEVSTFARLPAHARLLIPRGSVWGLPRRVPRSLEEDGQMDHWDRKC